MNNRMLVAFALPLLLPSVLGAQGPADVLPDPGPDGHLLYEAEDVEWQPAPASLETGAEVAVLEGNPAEPGIFTMRIRMPDGFRIAPHWHPEVERVTVLAGTFHLGSGDVVDPQGAAGGRSAAQRLTGRDRRSCDYSGGFA